MFLKITIRNKVEKRSFCPNFTQKITVTGIFQMIRFNEEK